MSRYPKPVLRGVMFVSVHEDGRMSVSTLLDPDTSASKKWEQLAVMNLQGEDVEAKRHEELAAALGSQLAARVGTMRDAMLSTRTIELCRTAVDASGSKHVVRRSCARRSVPTSSMPCEPKTCSCATPDACGR